MVGTTAAGDRLPPIIGANPAREVCDAVMAPAPRRDRSIACFVAGTRLATESGKVAVESLRVGDRARAVLSGRWEKITWIGHRIVDCTRHPAKELVWPIRVAAHAFGPCQPGRDLWLSPSHAVYVNDVLVPVGLLINGTSIRQVRLPAIAYWHVELPRHDVLLAEGLPTESYLDTGDRTDFLDNGAFITLFPRLGARHGEVDGCAPLITSGDELERVRAMVNERAAQNDDEAGLAGNVPSGEAPGA